MELPKAGTGGHRLGSYSDEFGTYELHIMHKRRLNAMEIAAIQTSHHKAQIIFSKAIETTRALLAVRTIDTSKKSTVMHCYALIYMKSWYIINQDGYVTKLCSSRQHQTIPQLVGATHMRLYELVAFTDEKPLELSNNQAPVVPNVNRDTSMIYRSYGALARFDKLDRLEY